jgi:hypothetical protein
MPERGEVSNDRPYRDLIDPGSRLDFKGNVVSVIVIVITERVLLVPRQSR